MNSLSNSRFKSNTFIENIIQILSMQKTVFANPHINMKSLNAKTDKRQFQRVYKSKVHHQIEQNKFFSMIPHSLHN